MSVKDQLLTITKWKKDPERVQLTSSTEPISQNRFTATDRLAVPVATCSYNSELETGRNRRTRKRPTTDRMPYDEADIYKVHLPREDRRRGFIRLEISHNYNWVLWISHQTTR